MNFWYRPATLWNKAPKRENSSVKHVKSMARYNKAFTLSSVIFQVHKHNSNRTSSPAGRAAKIFTKAFALLCGCKFYHKSPTGRYALAANTLFFSHLRDSLKALAPAVRRRRDIKRAFDSLIYIPAQSSRHPLTLCVRPSAAYRKGKAHLSDEKQIGQQSRRCGPR